MTEAQLLLKELFCEDCIKDDSINCKRDKDVKCLMCGAELCGHHILPHLKKEHLVSIEWRGV